jgi:hypothetical protein
MVLNLDQNISKFEHIQKVLKKNYRERIYVKTTPDGVILDVKEYTFTGNPESLKCEGPEYNNWLTELSKLEERRDKFPRVNKRLLKALEEFLCYLDSYHQ